MKDKTTTAPHESFGLNRRYFIYIGIALLGLVGGQLCITESYRHLSVAKGSTLQMLTHALTVACSVGLLGEHFTFLEIARGGAILLACYRIARMR